MKKTTLYQLHSYEPTQMMSYVLHTKHDKLIVIDGGNTVDGVHLLDFLHNLSGKKPVIEAWLFTHAHSDHINAFMDIIRNHHEAVEIKNICYCFPDAAFIDANEPNEAHTIHEFEELLPLFSPLVTFLHEGDTFTFDDITFDVLYTTKPCFTTNAINNSSTVLRMTAEGQRTVFLGDLGVEAGQYLLEKYGADGLHADICQMAHHGQNGVTRDVYAAIAPKVCLWTTPQWLWDNDCGKGYNTHIWQTVTVQGWMRELGVQQHLICKDGTQSIELPC